ncbi:BamA/TamA family outer membrane protein [Sedimentitalea sp. JM2-8]|uniref:BamA/TamA family outer membrane protein n=2 Tax=Sedimentitalea xiamensis TaxID=3050037 RepID=A0ABT7FBI4_9RHOB|nr:BamA/TamA family outer membrane protein [Sedimentitalea xiamensis]
MSAHARCFGLAVGLSASVGAVWADPTQVEQQVKSAGNAQKDSDFGFRSGSFVATPIPFSNPTIGSGLVLGLGYLFNIDRGSKPSVIGIAGLRSDNGTMGYGGSINLYSHDNRWQLETLFAEADIRYDLFTTIGTLPIRQEGYLGRVSLSYGVTPDLSFGGSMRYLKTDVSLDAPDLPSIPAPFNDFLNTEILSLGVVADWDTRDDTLYPTSGNHLQFEASRGIFLGGILPDYSRAFLNFSHYVAVGKNGVLAAMASTCAASSDTPFFDQCALGGTDSFRGFSFTQYLDDRSASVQVEYRQTLTPRFGGVVFGGAGLVGPTYGQLAEGGTHGAVGIGLRYRVSKKFPVDLSVDVTRNTIDENQLYIYVGQRF